LKLKALENASSSHAAFDFVEEKKEQREGRRQ
jgi:hypothetical protein